MPVILILNKRPVIYYVFQNHNESISELNQTTSMRR